MAEIADTYRANAYLDRSFERKGIGGWRQLYLQFIEGLAPGSVAELGAGDPAFLDRVSAARRIAVDVGTRFAGEFERKGIAFVQCDLDRESLEGVGVVDVAICSDVFEHLVNPAAALDRIVNVLAPDGILFSHVPNEYRLGHTLRVMWGSSDAILFHKGHPEWDDPHFRRFTDRGFRAFLARRFRHNLCLTDLRFGRAARLWARTGLTVPYALQGGPTYASTQDDAAFARLAALKRSIARG